MIIIIIIIIYLFSKMTKIQLKKQKNTEQSEPGSYKHLHDKFC